MSDCRQPVNRLSPNAVAHFVFFISLQSRSLRYTVREASEVISAKRALKLDDSGGILVKAGYY